MWQPLRVSQWLQVEKGQDALLHMFASSDVPGNSLDDDQFLAKALMTTSSGMTKGGSNALTPPGL